MFMLMFIKAIATFSIQFEQECLSPHFDHFLDFFRSSRTFHSCDSVWTTAVRDIVANSATQPGPCHGSLAARTALQGL